MSIYVVNSGGSWKPISKNGALVKDNNCCPKSGCYCLPGTYMGGLTVDVEVDGIGDCGAVYNGLYTLSGTICSAQVDFGGIVGDCGTTVRVINISTVYAKSCGVHHMAFFGGIILNGFDLVTAAPFSNTATFFHETDDEQFDCSDGGEIQLNLTDSVSGSFDMSGATMTIFF